MNFKVAVCVVLMGLASTAQAACPSAPGRFVASGAEVTDSQTGLVWARCSAGQSWSGSSCSGAASTHTHEQALALAQAATGWRLPNVKELTSITDKGCQSPATDSAAFPNTPSAVYWSSSPFVVGAGSAWVVDFDDGDVDVDGRNDGYAVRLVRANQ